MRSHARVVVIGGGVTGCAVAWHLATRGLADTVLLERQELTSGSSWHAAGSLFTLAQPSSVAILQKYTRDLYPRIESESGQPIGHHRTGGYSLAMSDDEHTKLKILAMRGARDGIASAFHTAEEARHRAPILNTDGVKAFLWEPDKGYVDPASVTQAFAIAARGRGVEIHRHTPVIATRRAASGEWLIETPAGSIRCAFIVNAAGLWAREVAALAGIRLPLMPVEHHYLVTGPVPEITTLSGDLPNISNGESNWYLRQEGQGLLLGAYERRCHHWAVDRTPADFGHELLPDDLQRMEENFADAVARVPALGEAGIKRVINGPMIFSPDLAPLVGPWPSEPSYICAAGVMTGFNQAGGVGRLAAEWIVDGEPSLDATAWDVGRFGSWADQPYVKARTGYWYEHRSHRVYPYQQITAGRPVRTSPIYDALKDRGAVFGESFGLEVPLWFARPGEAPIEHYSYGRQNWFEAAGEEARAVRNAVGLFEITSYGKIEVAGPDAERFLTRVLARRPPQAAGRIVLSRMLSPKGALIGEFSVARLAADRFLLIGSGAMQEIYMRWFAMWRAGDETVTFANRSAELTGLHLAGPHSRALLQSLTSADISNAAFPFLSARTFAIGSCSEALVLRLSFTGELGYEIYVPPEQQLDVFEALLARGSEFGLRLAGLRALQSLRLEKFYPAWGADLNASTGQNPVLLEVLGSVDAWGGELIFADGQAVGYVTSGAYGYNCGKSLAYAYLDGGASAAALQIEIAGERLACRVLPEAPIDPQGLRLRS